jgi:hypothetical protein
MMSRKLKSTKVIRINLSPEGQELRQNLLSLTEYHEKNEKAVKEIQYSPEGEPEQITCYEYDAKGYLISEEIKEGDETLVSKRTFEVDDNGRVEREFHHYSDGSVDTIDYGYNSLGQLVEKVVTDYEGEKESEEVFEYEGEHLVREAVVGGDGFLIRESLMAYSDEGLLDDITIRDLSEGAEVRKHYDYDEKSRRRGFVVYNENDELIERVLFKYDEKDRLSEVIDENRRQKNTTLLQYNDQGWVIKQEEYDLQGKLVSRVERVFEEDGRIVESKVFVNTSRSGMENYITRNEYTFY